MDAAEPSGSLCLIRCAYPSQRVRTFGPGAEGNPLILWLMGMLGEGPALATAKLAAASLGSLVDSEVSPLRILREISSRIPPEIEVEFRDFTVEEGRVRVEGVTTSFDAIDKIKADLSSYPRFLSVTVSDAKTGVEREKVLFKLTINLNREG